MAIEELRLIEGGMAVDDRGAVRFANGFNFQGVKRFYAVTNHRAGMIRAWHAHRREAKYATVLQGAAIIGAVRIDDWEKPSSESEVHHFVLCGDKPSVLYIPSGYANGFMSLTDDAIIMFFSTATVEESKNDDIRYDAYYWNIWDVIPR